MLRNLSCRTAGIVIATLIILLHLVVERVELRCPRKPSRFHHSEHSSRFASDRRVSKHAWSNRQNESLNCDSIPKSDQDEVERLYRKFFAEPRESKRKPSIEPLRDHLRELGFENVEIQYHYNMYFNNTDNNVILVVPSKRWKTAEDRILLVGAHWDTLNGGPGVEDNGSGSTAVLQIAHQIMKAKCTFGLTLMLVWFDHEEMGLMGSESFVEEYLIKEVVDKYGSKFVGAYIADMIMINESENGTQLVPDFLHEGSPELVADIVRDNYRGDFLTVLHRESDDFLVKALRKSWVQLYGSDENRRLKSWGCGFKPNQTPTRSEYKKWPIHSKSDHKKFWITESKNISFNAVLLFDMGLWRKSYQRCYHHWCDNSTFITDNNLKMLVQVTDALMTTLIDLGEGCCSKTGMEM